jgi:septum formation protein
MYRLCLASQSPRRFELLQRAGFAFSTTSPQISEILNENLNLPEQIHDLAIKKAQACVDFGKVLKGQNYLVLSADTVVVLSGEILGKPKDQIQNMEFLRRLSGQVQDVITAVCLLDVDRGFWVVGHETSRILFRQLSEDEISTYVRSGDGLDKAGGYGIQGEAGKFVEKLEGNFDNVMGLPVALVEKMLKENGWNVTRQ